MKVIKLFAISLILTSSLMADTLENSVSCTVRLYEGDAVYGFLSCDGKADEETRIGYRPSSAEFMSALNLKFLKSGFEFKGCYHNSKHTVCNYFNESNLVRENQSK